MAYFVFDSLVHIDPVRESSHLLGVLEPSGEVYQIYRDDVLQLLNILLLRFLFLGEAVSNGSAFLRGFETHHGHDKLGIHDCYFIC